MYTHIYTQTDAHTLEDVVPSETLRIKLGFSLCSVHVGGVRWTRGKVKSEFNIDNSKSALRKQNKTYG